MNPVPWIGMAKPTACPAKLASAFLETQFDGSRGWGVGVEFSVRRFPSHVSVL